MKLRYEDIDVLLHDVSNSTVHNTNIRLLIFYSSTSRELRLRPIYLHSASLHVRQDLKRSTALASGQTNSSLQHPTQIAMQMQTRPLAVSYNTYIEVMGIDTAVIVYVLQRPLRSSKPIRIVKSSYPAIELYYIIPFWPTRAQNWTILFSAISEKFKGV